MSVADLLRQLDGRGVELELRAERLICRAPRGGLTPELAQELRDRKAEIVAFLREGLVESVGAAEAPPIRPVERQELMPVSFSQERLWYLNQVDRNPAVYNLPLAFRLRGRVDVGVLQRCLDTLEARHEALRTTIVARDGQAMQRIREPCGLPLAQIDLRPGHTEPGTADPEAQLQCEAMAPFDLSEGPLVRARLILDGEDESYFLLVTHHVIADGLSTQILLRELVALYEAFQAGRPSPLGPMPLQFADYAVWQRGWLRGDSLDRQARFWQQHLQPPLPTLDVPTDYPRPPVRSAGGAKERLRLSEPMVDALSRVARAEGATTYMALLGVYVALLYRYSGQEDFVVGTPVGNRARRECADMVGFLANTLALRVRLDGRPSFRQTLRRVRDTCVGAFRHQDMPFQKLVELLNPPRDLSRTPIFQAFFTFHEISSQPTRMGNLQLEPVVAGSNVARMDLSLFLREFDAEILGSLEYNTDVFSRETVRRMIGHMETLAASAAAEPDVAVSDLPMLTAAEQESLERWNATAAPIPGVLVHELVSAQADATPERVAVRSARATLTYAELEARSDTIARLLRARGVEDDRIVGVCIGRSENLIVALLGVLKSGAAYLPIDPDYPTVRIAWMVQDAGVELVLHDGATEGLPPTGPALVDVRTVSPDEGSPTEPVPCGASPESLAYVIYTSGSTGKPKGVEVRHRNVVNFLRSMRQCPGIESEDVLVAVTTPAFDISVLELFLPLTVGACVAVAPREAITDGVELAEYLEKEGATIMQATPATWRMLLEAGWSGLPLRALCGGEALPSELAARLLPAVRELWNMYGPTETTIWSTCARVTDPEAPISVGEPIANTILRVTDRFGQLVPPGNPGELLIGGAGVARGYRGRPDLTSERFVADPVGERGGGTFYRTGDIVRMRSGGLECLGRADTQVKVQGFRIELGEVEAMLMVLDEVREAVVTSWSDLDGSARLVAYVVFRPGAHLTASEVRRHLRTQLPSFMVPGMVMVLDSLPRTPNGKIDRGGLPNPLVSDAVERRAEPPVTEAERIVTEVWSSLLGMERIGRHDNFFELGGHSLLSMRAVAAIEQRTGVRLDPRLMFFRTVEQIAAHLDPSQVATGP